MRELLMTVRRPRSTATTSSAIDAAEAGHLLPTFDQQLADAVDLVEARSGTRDRGRQTG